MASIGFIRKVSDILFSALVFVLAMTFFVMSFSLPRHPALMPRLVALFTAVLDLPVLIKSMRQKSEKDEPINVPVYTTSLILFGYYLALIFFGYIISSLALVVVIARLMGQKSWIATVALSVIITGVTFYVFKVLFNVDLPNGFIFGGGI